MNRYLLIISLLIMGCDSAESPTLKECRVVQENLIRRTSSLDSSLQEHVVSLQGQSIALSTDTMLAIDSLLRLRYSYLKESVIRIEMKQAELHRWRDQLILLPSREEIARGARNPFGDTAGDAGILQALTAYGDTLTILESGISDLIRNTTYERTSPPQP